MKNRWAFSICATRRDEHRNISVRHAAGVIKAKNAYEAQGMANAIAKKVYRTADGWAQHGAAVEPAGTLVDPENPNYGDVNR